MTTTDSGAFWISDGSTTDRLILAVQTVSTVTLFLVFVVTAYAITLCRPAYKLPRIRQRKGSAS